MIIKNVTFDGQTSGIVAKSKVGENNKKARFITLGDKVSPRIFNNLEIAKLTAKIIMPNVKFDYFLKFGKKKVNINSCFLLDGIWQYIEGNTLYLIKENRSRKTSYLGYICFEDGDTKRCDKEYGIPRQKELFDYIKYELGSLLCENIGVSRIEKKGKEFIVHFIDTTYQIHIMYGQKLMSYNQAQRAAGKKCLPFIKDVDKFLTFYIYIDKDRTESIRLNGEEIANTMKKYIMDDLVEFYQDANPKYIDINYDGYIILED